MGPVKRSEGRKGRAEAVRCPAEGGDLQGLCTVLAAFFCPKCGTSVLAVLCRLTLRLAVCPFGLPSCLVAGLPPLDLLALLPAAPCVAVHSVFPAGRSCGFSRTTRPAGSGVLTLAFHII